MGGDKNAVLEDANLVGEDVDVEDAATCRVRHAVEIAADAHHALMRTRRSSLVAKRLERKQAARPPIISISS